MTENIHHRQAVAGMQEAAKSIAPTENMALAAIQLQSQLAIAYELRTANIIATMALLGSDTNSELYLRLYERLLGEEQS